MTPQCKESNKVCIFDIDNTLTHAEHAKCYNRDDSVRPSWPPNSGTNTDVKEMIKQCHEHNYHIAIASAESGEEQGLMFSNPKQRAFIRSLDPTYDNTIFNDEFFQSPAFQGSCSVVKTVDRNGDPWCRTNEHPRKEAMIQNILNYFNISPDVTGCSILFDDDISNLATATAMGLRAVQSSLECGGKYCDRGCGIRWSSALGTRSTPAVF